MSKIYFFFILIITLIFTSCKTERGNMRVGRTESTILDTLSHFIHLPGTTTRDTMIQELNKVLDKLQDKSCKTVDCVTDDAIRLISSSVTILASDTATVAVSKIQKALVGQSTTDLIKIIAQLRSLLEDIPSKQSIERIALLREALLGPDAAMDLKGLLDVGFGSMDTNGTRMFDHFLNVLDVKLNSTLNHLFATISGSGKVAADSLFTSVDAHGQKLGDIINGNVSRAGNYVLAIIICIILFVITLVWGISRVITLLRYKRTATLLAKHIHHMPNRESYDLLTHDIQSEAISTGIQPFLNKLLDQNSLLKSETWKKGART